MQRMLGMRGLPPVNLQGLDLQGLSAEVLAAFEQMQQRIEQHELDAARREAALAERTALLQRKERDLALRDAKIEKLEFEIARYKRWKFAAKTEAMNAEQRRLFEETVFEDEASLQAQLAALQAGLPETPKRALAPRAKPRRQVLPEHLERVEHHHEPEDTACPTPECGKPMQRIGQDVSERLDIVPARFFVHRHIYGKWACKCCQQLRQEPAEPDVVDGGIPASGLVAHTLISRFADHLPYYRQEAINARSGVHTPRSTLAAWAGAGGAALQPLYDAHKRFVLECRVLHADETPIPLLDPGAGKTRRAYIWAYARSHHDPNPGVIYEFCPGRGAQHPQAFLAGDQRAERGPWAGTLLTDRYSAYDSVLDAQAFPGRVAAGCAAHARRKFEELAKASTSAVAEEALQRWARIYHVEGNFAQLAPEQRLDGRQRLSRPLWQELQAWLRLERARVPDGSRIAQAINYSLQHWTALSAHLHDGAVPIDNNLIERQIKPWKLGAKNWLFIGSELAGQRAAIVMSLVQSAKLNGIDPWAYLRDVLARIHGHPNQRIDELLPHRWRPA
jgi:transposase